MKCHRRECVAALPDTSYDGWAAVFVRAVLPREDAARVNRESICRDVAKKGYDPQPRPEGVFTFAHTIAGTYALVRSMPFLAV